METLKAISSFVTSAPFEQVFGFKNLLLLMLDACYAIANQNIDKAIDALSTFDEIAEIEPKFFIG